MKCQACDNAAVHHVTELIAGEPVEYHVCEAHLQNVESLGPAMDPRKPATGFGAFLGDSDLRELWCDREAQEKLAAYLLPPLCLGLLDQRPEVKVVAAFRLMTMARDARSAIAALRDASQDSDARVRKAAEIALAYIESNAEPPWFV